MRLQLLTKRPKIAVVTPDEFTILLGIEDFHPRLLDFFPTKNEQEFQREVVSNKIGEDLLLCPLHAK